MGRKLLLTSFVLFVDLEEGSTKILRLYVAALVSAVYLLLLCLAQPLRRTDNLYLAAGANLLLLLSFLSGIVIKLCGADGESEPGSESPCEALVGLSGQYEASLVVVFASILVLAGTVLLICWQAFSVTRATIRLRATHEEPRLKLPKGCHFHAFVSDAFRTP